MVGIRLQNLRMLNVVACLEVGRPFSVCGSNDGQSRGNQLTPFREIMSHDD